MPNRNRSSRLRTTVLVLGLLIICCGLVALTFSFWPLPDMDMQITIPPTLLTPP